MSAGSSSRPATATACALAASFLAFTPGAAGARILLVQTPDGAVYKNFPEPAGAALPRPGVKARAYKSLVSSAAQRHGVDQGLVEAVIACESDFEPGAVSSAGACGLMQLMPDTSKMYGLQDPFDAEGNVEAGTRHLASLLASFRGDRRLAVAAYNAGEQAVRRAGGVPDFPETIHYVAKVEHYLSCLRGAAPDVPDAASEIASLEPRQVVAPEPIPQPEPPRGHPVVMGRDATGRLVFVNAKGKGKRK